MYGDGEASWISDLGGVRNKLLRFLSTLLGGVLTTPINQKSAILAQNWSTHTRTQRMPILYCRCGGFNDVGLYGEAPGVGRGSPRRGWLQIDVAASGDALCCTGVRPSVGKNFIYLINDKRNMAHAWTGTQREHPFNLTGQRIVSHLTVAKC